MQSSRSYNEPQGDHNYVATLNLRRNRSTSSDDSSIELNHPARRRTRRTRGRLGDTDHDYIGLRAFSEEDGEVEDEFEAFVEPSNENTDEAHVDYDGGGNNANENGRDDDSVNNFAEEAQEMLIADLSQERQSYNEAQENAERTPLVLASTENNDAAASNGFVVPNNEVLTVDLVLPSPAKKRKRHNLGTPKLNTPRIKTKGGSGDEDDEEDEGMTCPICLDNWEMSGEHRLVSLRCGHLFGDSCIRRWLAESARQSGIKACPQCKAKATNRDIRCLYAKRLRAIDRSEEHRLRDQLEEERRRAQSLQTEVAALKMTHKVVTMEMQTLQAENDRLKQMLRGSNNFSYSTNLSEGYKVFTAQMHRLYLERTIELTREPGCRVLIHADQHSSILASQKSAQGLFPGYGVRFIDVSTLRTSTFLHASTKLLRDICLNADQQQLAVASMETRSKLFDLRTRQVVSVFEPGEKTLWACAIDRKERDNILYLGGSNGSTYAYDMRFPENILEEYKTEADFSTVINVASVFPCNNFPHGGFLACKLQSLWFYEYTSFGSTTIATRLNLEGPFSSMQFDAAHETLLVSARCSVRHPQSRYIVGRLEKLDGTTVLNIKITFHGSKATPVMTRCTQVAVEANTLVASYIQDVKQLALFDVCREKRIQVMPAQEVIYDICPIYANKSIFLAGLSETKCRMYKLTSSSS